MIRHARWIAVAIAIGCGGSSPGGGSDSTGPLSCEHGSYDACVCSDGSMGTQLCAHDTSGYEPCVCGGGESAEAGPTTMGSSSSADTVDATTDDGSSSGVGTTATSSGEGAGSTSEAGSSGGMIGEAPSVMINHPGGEDRTAGVPIPFIGVAIDPEDGPLDGPAMQWTDDLEGAIGQGQQFDAVLDVVGDHVVTLSAMDSDGNLAEATLMFSIVP